MSKTNHLTDDDLIVLYIRYATGQAYVSDLARENNLAPYKLSQCFSGQIRRKARVRAGEIMIERKLPYRPKYKNSKRNIWDD